MDEQARKEALDWAKVLARDLEAGPRRGRMDLDGYMAFLTFCHRFFPPAPRKSFEAGGRWLL